MRIFSTAQALTILGLGAVSLGLAQKPADEHVPGRLLAQRAASANDTDVEQVVALIGAKVHHKIDRIGVLVLEVPEPALDAVSQVLMRTGRFTFVERDYIAHVESTTPNDPNFPSQWHLNKLQAPDAWSITLGSAGVPIAIIDSGADSSQPDLAPKLIPGWNFLTGTSNTSDTGCNTGHGTAVSGAAGAATNNLIGGAGVAWANMIMPLVVVNSSCVAMYSDIASAINYAADHGVRIINISIGGSTASSTLQSAVDYAWGKGAVIFAAAGNNSSSTPIYPAACNHVVSVSATVSSDTLASFSNYGSWIDLSAPGDMILTTQVGGSYGYWYGTSLASPIAAAVGALALSANPSLSATALVSLLEQNSDDLGTPGYDQYFGWGRVNAYKAVCAAKGLTPDTTPPKVSITFPLAGATVSGTIAVTGTASDNIGVTKIEFYVDGVLTSMGTAVGFSFSWNSTSKANGSHTLMVKAYDAAGNTSPASVSVNVNNVDITPPTVTIISPLAGATVSGTVGVTGTASDNIGVTKVEFYVDAVLSSTGTAAAFSFSWNSTSKANGSHTLLVKAYDAANNTSSASVSVSVNNAAIPPTLGLIGYWNFDEGTGLIAHDTSGGGHNGTVHGASWTLGKINGALSFNGSTNNVVTGNIALGNTFSVSAWVNPAAAPQKGYIRIVETRYNGGLYLGTNINGTKYKLIVNTGHGSTGGCGITFGCAEGGAIATGWHLVTGTYDGTTGKLYVDGALVASDTFTPPPATNLPLYIGSYDGGGYVWNGAADEVRLYNRALTATEVGNIFMQ